MPSPFPGMDPYLEGSDWRSVHTHLSVEIARYLAPRLQPKYFVRTEKNYILEISDLELDSPLSRRSPDVSVMQSHTPSVSSPGGVTAIEAPLHRTVALLEEEIQVVVEIYDVTDRSLVTAIEVLSATNKNRGGRAEYLAKRRKYMRSSAHLMEIDLLRTGERVPLVEPLPDSDYFVVLSRADKRPIAEVWPASIRFPLPAVPVPLLAGDTDVALDLQAVLTSMYDAFRYDLDLNYDEPPEIPLRREDAEWAVGILQSRKAV